MAKRVAVIAPDGTFGTLDESEVGNLPDGARVLSQKEVETHDAEVRQEERAEKAGIGGKIQTVVGAVGGALNPLMYTGGPGSSGEAYNRGVTSGLTAGMNEVVERKALDTFASPGAGASFAQNRDDIRAASPTAHTAGEVMGFAAGATALPASPAGIIGKAGGLVEGGAGLVLKGGGGALRQAATTGVKMGLRGAVEGGIATGMQSAADDLVHDREINGEKLYTMMGHGALGGAVLGGGLGFTGSLAVSGAKAGARSVIRGLARSAEENPGGKLAQVLTDADGAARGLANEQAWRATSAGKRFADQAAAKFKGGTREVADAGIRHGIIIEVPEGLTPRQAAMHAAQTSTPAEMLPRGIAARERIGSQLGDIAESTGGRASAAQIMAAVEDTAQPYAAKAGFEHVENGVRSYGTDLIKKLGISSVDDTVSVKDLLFQRRALDDLIYKEASARDPGVRVAALRELRGRLEEIVTGSIDAASGKVPGAERARYNSLKKDYAAVKLLTDAIEDSASRTATNRTISPSDYLAAASSAASGHPLAAPVVAIGHKLVRERGNAAAAAYLTRAAEQQTFSKLMQKAEALVGDSVKGLLAEAPTTPRKLPPAKKAPRNVADGKAEHDAVREEAKAIQKWHGGISENPRSTFSQLQEAAALVGRHAGPRAAAAYTASTLKAISYVSRYVPVKERRDPLDPRSVPPLTLDEAQTLTRAYRYASDPKTVWQDFAKGIVTPEGIEAAKELMPEQFALFQVQLFDRVQDHLLHNRQLTQSHRLRIDKLLEGAAIRPDDVARNQQDFEGPAPEPEQGPSPTGNKSVDMPIQQSGFDAVEMRKAQ